MSEAPRLGPPSRPAPEGTLPHAATGRPPRSADERAGAAAAAADLEAAGRRRDPDLERAGGGAGDDLTLEEMAGRPPMTFIEHLDELRGRLLRSVAAILAGAALGWWISAPALEWAVRRTVGTVQVLDPVESFSERFKLALVLGACVALPVVFYQMWSFVLPGLFRRERNWILPLVSASVVLFFAGAALAVFVVVPIVLDVLRTFLTPSMRQNIRLSSLLGFLYNLALACGLVFQLPLVAGALAALRLVSARTLLAHWRVAIVVTLAIGALITPGDVVTAQIILGLPLGALYLLSVAVAWLVERARGRRPAEVA